MALDKAAFFTEMERSGMALTYDDVRLRTAVSNVSPREVNVVSRFSKNVELQVPLVSAAMDTVTTAPMAIAMAKFGGLGVIHAGLSPEMQRVEVRRVKLHLNGRIEKPVTVLEDQTISEVLEMCSQRGFDFRSFPVVNKHGKLTGLVSDNDFAFCSDHSHSVKQAMTPLSELQVADLQTTGKKAYDIMRKAKKKTLPLVHSDGTVAGLYILSDVLRVVQDNPDDFNLDHEGRLRVAAAVPTDEESLVRVESMLEYLDVAVIDTAQGDSKYAIETLKSLKAAFPKLDVVIGNISEAASAAALAKAGADGIKIGQGPGAICTTRPETGIGCPQLTAVYECAKAVRSYNIPVCADGGIVNPGDISIAIAAGADSVMMGSKLAGSKETPGEIVMSDDGKMVKLYRGMGSPSALRDSAASRKRYGVEGSGKPLSEGVESYVPYKGPVEEIMSHYTKALRKSMSYVGAKDIATHQKETGFWRITNAGMRESHPHDVSIITQ